MGFIDDTGYLCSVYIILIPVKHGRGLYTMQLHRPVIYPTDLYTMYTAIGRIKYCAGLHTVYIMTYIIIYTTYLYAVHATPHHIEQAAELYILHIFLYDIEYGSVLKSSYTGRISTQQVEGKFVDGLAAQAIFGTDPRQYTKLKGLSCKEFIEVNTVHF
ncbi:hypothetical protein D3C80_1374890 [compost metagenome]